MDINSLKVTAAYANITGTASSSDNPLRDRNLDASETGPDTESTRAANEAFKVTITQEAQALLAAGDTEEPVEDKTATSKDQAGQNTAQVHEVSQIVNIIS